MKIFATAMFQCYSQSSSNRILCEWPPASSLIHQGVVNPFFTKKPAHLFLNYIFFKNNKLQQL